MGGVQSPRDGYVYEDTDALFRGVNNAANICAIDEPLYVLGAFW